MTQGIELGELLVATGISTLKVLPAVAFALLNKFTWYEIFISVSVGGISGVVFFSFWGTRIRAWMKERRKRKGRKKPINIRKARRIVKLWRRFGIYGIAFLTPPFISPPIGAIISVAFGESYKRILLYMSISTLAWAALFALLGDKILNLIE
jgi:MFS family permease